LATATLRDAMRELLQAPGRVARRDGDVGAARPARTIEALYDTPYLAHATMEPQNCTAWVKRDGVELWVGTQAQTYAQRAAAEVAGVRPDQVTVHTMLLGGGFGRRSAPDFVPHAVEIAKVAGVPVKLVYTREDDMRGCYYRPMALTRLTGGIDADGRPVAFTARCASSSLARASGNTAIAQSGYDRSAVEGLANWPYATPNVLVDWQPFEPGVPVWFWRSVGSSHNTFIAESFIDELAHLAGKDPYEYRRALLADHRRHRGVLELAATRAGWSVPPPAGRARGIAVAEAFGSFCAQVAEVSMGTDGVPHVHKVVCAIDCGAYVNPNIIRAQMEGGIVYALSQVLYGEITFRNGRVEQSNFHDYKVVRMPEAPAVCNAIFALTGKRIRKLPLDFDRLKSI
ncbi:MAG: xanthine dehydrogenase family protein molybdopterin-binding subunit, partial [Casimicrobiaceae bacterium]